MPSSALPPEHRSPVPADSNPEDTLRGTIAGLEAIVSNDPTALLTNRERPGVDRSITQALATLTDDPNTLDLVQQFSPGTDRRPARVSDVLVTLRLLDAALQQHGAE